MNTSVRNTVVFGLLAGLSFMALDLLSTIIHWPLFYRLWMTAVFGLYGVMLCRKAGRNPIRLAIPMLTLGVLALLGVESGAFTIVALAVLVWMRSGICFQGNVLRSAIAEIVSIGGGAGVLIFMAPTGTLGIGLGVWAFFLVQSIYVLMISAPDAKMPEIPGDPFDIAMRNANRILARR